jgi:hypothetical protein
VSGICSLPTDLRSGSDRVLVQNSAESVDSPDLHRVIEWLARDMGDRDLEIDPAVRPCCVVMLGELFEHAFEMTLVSDEQPVETFPTRGANESLGERVRTRRANRCLDDPSTDRLDDFIEGPDELRIPVADQEVDGSPGSHSPASGACCSHNACGHDAHRLLARSAGSTPEIRPCLSTCGGRAPPSVPVVVCCAVFHASFR